MGPVVLTAQIAATDLVPRERRDIGNRIGRGADQGQAPRSRRSSLARHIAERVVGEHAAWPDSSTRCPRLLKSCSRNASSRGSIGLVRKSSPPNDSPVRRVTEVAVSAQEGDRNPSERRIRFQHAAHRVSIHSRQFHVQQDDVRAVS